MEKVVHLEKPKINKVSIICPFFNEELIIETAAQLIVKSLKNLPVEWELILVDDGSTDDSLSLVSKTMEMYPRVRIITYKTNQGRGEALRTGINYAQGDIIVTTEIDLSWGEDIIKKIVSKFQKDTNLDVVIASPNLKSGGYKNVPFLRVFLSKLGNTLIRILFVRSVTMCTGMTRGYRREVFQSLRTYDKGKEFHLEVLLKLYALGLNIAEVPATLEWKNNKLSKDKKRQRKSSLALSRVITTHLNFLFLAQPIKYFWFVSLLFTMGTLISLSFGVYRLLTGQISIYLVIFSLLLAVCALLFFACGVITELSRKILKELWRKDAI